MLDTGSWIKLTYTDEQVGEKLAEIWEFNQANFRYDNNPIVLESKWKSIRAVVTHDLENFGKAYLVSHIELAE